MCKDYFDHSENETFLQGLAKQTPSNGFATKDEELTWSDLAPSSQEKLLEVAVNLKTRNCLKLARIC